MIIGFGHRQYVGKDTAARFLFNYLRFHGIKDVQQLSFATDLKRICRELFPAIHTNTYYDQAPKEKDRIIPIYGMSARQIWIKVGNDMRAIDPLVWIHKTLNTKAKHLIVRDVRYDDEVEAILELDGVIVRIDRDEIPKSDDVADSCLANYTGWSKVIKNNLDLVDLHDQVVTLAKEYFGDELT